MCQGTQLPTARTTTWLWHPDSPATTPGSPAIPPRRGPCACASPAQASPTPDALDAPLPYAKDLPGRPGTVPNSPAPDHRLVPRNSTPPTLLDCHEYAEAAPMDLAPPLGGATLLCLLRQLRHGLGDAHRESWA